MSELRTPAIPIRQPSEREYWEMELKWSIRMWFGETTYGPGASFNRIKGGTDVGMAQIAQEKFHRAMEALDAFDSTEG